MLIIARAPVSTLAGAISPLLGRFAPGEKTRVLKPLDEYLDARGETRRAKVTARLLAEFACGGFALAVLGALVLIDEVVRSRTNEIGIRRALGAPARSVVLLASRETFVAAIVGVVAGTFAGARFGPVVAVWMKGSISSRFLPVTSVSPSIIVATALGLALLTAAATALRATRAARLDPAIALRIE
jgi:putative ABC transport system permease protein